MALLLCLDREKWRERKRRKNIEGWRSFAWITKKGGEGFAGKTWTDFLRIQSLLKWKIWRINTHSPSFSFSFPSIQTRCTPSLYPFLPFPFPSYFFSPNVLPKNSVQHTCTIPSFHVEKKKLKNETLLKQQVQRLQEPSVTLLVPSLKRLYCSEKKNISFPAMIQKY